MFQRFFSSTTPITTEYGDDEKWELVLETHQKRVYKVSTKDMNNEDFVNWSKNRPPDPIRIAQIRDYFMNKNTELIQGVICVWKHGGQYHVYDGIHRLHAALQLDHEMTALIQVFSTDKEQDVIDDFTNINKSINVPVIYLEETNWMKRKRVSFVSPSRNPYRYNFNRDNLVDFLSTLEIDFSMQGVDKILLNEFEGLNLRAMDYVASNKIKHPSKCNYHKFWLFYLEKGLIKHCLENACKRFQT